MGGSNYILQFLMRIIILFLAIPIHEAAHAWAALKCGDETSRNQGRLTINPFAHLDFFGSLCMLITGFGWGKPVMVNPSNFKNRKRDSVLVAFAGPASNLLLGLLLTIVLKLLIVAKIVPVIGNAFSIFQYIIILNIYLAVFNILPVPPLDGSKLLLAVLPPKQAFALIQYQQYIFIAMIVLLYFTPLSSLLSLISYKVLDLFDLITGFIH